MDVRCEKCGTEYEFDENRIGPNGVTVKCTNCGHVFKVRRNAARLAIPRASTTIGAGPQGREWLVRKPDGQMIAFRELTTLQKWIVEGRIYRDDEISKNGETWKRLGNILELEPFFSVYEKAQTLNSLIEQQPVQLRGSELLAAVSPTEGQSSQNYPIPSRSQILQADPLPSQLPSQVPQTLPRRAPSPAPQPPPLHSRPPEPADPMPTLPPPPSPVAERLHAPTTGLAGPATLERTYGKAPPPASFHAPALDFSDSDDLDEDPVGDFERGQRRRRLLIAALLLVSLALGASMAVVMYGPKDNALRVLAEKYGLVAADTTDTEAAALIEQARQKSDLDTLAAQAEGLDLLGRAQAMRPSDMDLLADRGMHVALLAGAFQTWAEDLERSASEAEAALQSWETAKAAAKKGSPPARPEVGDPAALRAEAKAKLRRRDQLLAQATDVIKKTEAADATALPALRARAALAVVSRAPDRPARIAAATKAAEAAGHDPILLYLDAVRLFEANSDEARTEARARIDNAVDARPSFHRARALSARLHLVAGALEPAKKALAKIQATAPEHEEAKRLAARLEVANKPPPAPPPPVAAPPPAEPKRNFEYWMNRGDRLRRRDRTMDALNAYGRAAEMEPNSAEVHVGKGWCLLDLERPHPALAAFERAVKANERYAEAYYGKGEALRIIGRKEAAVEAYRTYLARAPAGGAERRVVEQRLKELGGS